MCLIRNVHTCQCLGDVEPAFTPQDVRSCPCPSIIRMYGLRRRCERCRWPEKQHTRRWTSRRRNGSGGKMQETRDVEVTQEQGNTQRRISSATASTDLRTQSIAEDQSIYYTPQSMPSEPCSQERGTASRKHEIFTSSTWNHKRPHETPRIGRWAICGEADIVNAIDVRNEQRGGTTNQQIIDQIEVLLGQLTGLHLSGLVVTTCKV